MRLPHVLLFSSIFNFGSPEGLLPEGLRCSRPERLPEEIGVASRSAAEPSRSVNLRILHGQETKWNWPFIVRLGMRDSNGIIRLCGGTILNQRWIITGKGSFQKTQYFCRRSKRDPWKAASCAYGREVVGLIASDEINGKIEEFETRNFARGVYFHTDFKPEGNLTDDVAMIELERDFELNDKLQPACLPHNDQDYTKMQCFIGDIFCF